MVRRRDSGSHGTVWRQVFLARGYDTRRSPDLYGCLSDTRDFLCTRSKNEINFRRENSNREEESRKKEKGGKFQLIVIIFGCANIFPNKRRSKNDYANDLTSHYYSPSPDQN